MLGDGLGQSLVYSRGGQTFFATGHMIDLHCVGGPRKFC